MGEVESMNEANCHSQIIKFSFNRKDICCFKQWIKRS